MSARILNQKPIHQLFDHILDGFKSTHEGAGFIFNEGIINHQEYIELLEKNATRLIERVRLFKLANNLLSLFFAVLFIWMQVGGDDLEMRRPTRGRRRNEKELVSRLKSHI
jgi:hypothetical protein